MFMALRDEDTFQVSGGIDMFQLIPLTASRGVVLLIY